MNTLNHLIEASLVVEKLRVQSEVRLSHLKLNGKKDSETEELHSRIEGLEEWVDGRVADLIKTHLDDAESRKNVIQNKRVGAANSIPFYLFAMESIACWSGLGLVQFRYSPLDLYKCSTKSTE